MRKIPASFQDITVEQYQHCHSILKGRSEVDFYAECLSYLFGKPETYYNNLDFGALHAEIDKLKSVLNPPPNSLRIYDTIIIGGKPYKGLTDITKGNFAQYSSIKTILAKGESTPNLHLLLGHIYAPLKLFSGDYDMVATGETMKSAKVSQVLGLVFFYSRVFKNLTPIINDYMRIAEQELRNQSQTSAKHTVGI